MPTPSNIKTPPVEEPPIVVAPPSGFFNVIRPPPPSFPGELTPQWVAVELPPSLMSQIMEQLESGNKIGVTMTPEMFKDIWEMTHLGPWTPPSPAGVPPIEHGPVKGSGSPPGKAVSEPVLPPGKEHGPVGGGGSTTPPKERPIPIATNTSWTNKGTHSTVPTKTTCRTHRCTTPAGSGERVGGNN